MKDTFVYIVLNTPLNKILIMLLTITVITRCMYLPDMPIGAYILASVLFVHFMMGLVNGFFLKASEVNTLGKIEDLPISIMVLIAIITALSLAHFFIGLLLGYWLTKCMSYMEFDPRNCTAGKYVAIIISILAAVWCLFS